MGRQVGQKWSKKLDITYTYVDGPIPVKVIKFITYFHSWRMAISRSIFLRSNEPNISTLKYSLNFFNSELLHINKE